MSNLASVRHENCGFRKACATRRADPLPDRAGYDRRALLLREPDRLADDSQSWLGLLGRSKRGISTKQTRADLGVIAGQIGHSQLGQTAVKWSHAPHTNWRIPKE